VAFEQEGAALDEEMLTCLEAARGRLKAFVKKATGDSMQYAMALVKSHDPKADLDLLGDVVAANCTEAEWKAHFAAVGPLTEQIMAR
jgi:hypothetical protein